MSFFSAVKNWFQDLWYDLGFPQTVPYKEKKMPVSPASTGSGLVSTNATYYGAKKPAKKTKKTPPKKKVK